ncbi:GNAT family N-acetyltransferase [Fibrella aquatilis]|uniref:GNAT family N-acetyltransferase n=1 Tax=Fibrella aquatilis TaxID=2817059 RepID=A0A939GBR8_9BACT|nr:GNAT family N-acetyltransferase [Fibrella aquatilis]MBO0933483.1 GNAT family N-acetyltransferase [Fibrella aquatilis]
MTDSPITLRFVEAAAANPAEGLLATEHFLIIEKESDQIAGTIRLRLSNDDEVRLYAGHIGYGIVSAFRGNQYAAHACEALRPIALQHGYTELWITCDPDNWPSRRTCERLGARLIEIIDLPEDNDMYLDGERKKCRYLWQLTVKQSIVVDQ